jgi:acetyltransferase-like isoleucine patch superfamily enzyme
LIGAGNVFAKLIHRIRESLYWRRLWKKDPTEWHRQKALRYGVRMGRDCRIMSLDFSSEPYLVELGDHVLVASHVRFITHEAGWLFTDGIYPGKNIFGCIKVGNNVIVGMGSIILPGTEIGDNCIVGAGSVVRGNIPSDSVIAGNPAKVVMKLPLYQKVFLKNKNMIEIFIDGPRSDYQKRKQILREHFSVDC